MREALLHFIWQFRYFNQQELFTEAGEPLLILSAGEWNQHQGPDFLKARITIGGTLREGPVELHLRASDWLRHAHDGDLHYREVILHVVWENDCPDPPDDIPILVLRQRTSKLLLGQYRQWMNSRAFVPCERRLPEIDEDDWAAWHRRLLLHRLRQRSLFIRSCLEDNRQHWEETTWWLMARSMGQPVNGAAFFAIGRSLPLRLMLRHRGDPFRLEALLLGQAGLLEDEFREEYPAALQKEYRFCRARYELKAVSTPLSFLRMRPGHFPTIRLVQLAHLLNLYPGWFALIRETESARDLMSRLDVTLAGYWEDHYLPGQPSIARPKRMGTMIKKSILINAFVPLLFAYGLLREMPVYREKALRWLEETGPETNVVINRWRRLGIIPATAATSQSLLELKKGFCDPKRCLDCAVGQRLLGQGVIEQPRPGSS
ncbi:MAG TPA: DUF2851 family protein [Puia sp.]|nr:DUF2851 family protein [Puia sp.]